MEFVTEEVKTTLALTDEQINGLKPLYDNTVAMLKKDWDGVDNKNAENILAGAAKYAQTKFGITEERQQGEKYGDFLNRIADKGLEVKQANVTRLEQEYAKKLKDFKGDDATKGELEAVKLKLDDANKILADFDNIKAKADKFDETSQALTGFKKSFAYNSVKPNFPTEANPYEVKAKWDAFEKDTDEKWLIEIVDNEPIAISKENEHKRIKLSELVKENKDIETLLQGRQQGGTGARSQKDATILKVEGLSFDVSSTAKTDTKERATLIKDQLAKEGITTTSPNYSEKFAEYNKKIVEAK